MNRMNYVHRPCFFLAIALACGIWFGTRTSLACAAPAILGTAVLFIALLRWSKGWNSWVVLVCFVFMGSVGAAHARRLAADDVARLSYEQRQAVAFVEGVVISEPSFRQTGRGEKTSFEFQVNGIGLDRSRVRRTGRVLVNIFRQEEFRYGDRLRIAGKLHQPFDEGLRGRFSYREYLRRNGIQWVLSVKRSSPVELAGHGHGDPLQAMLLNLRRKFQSVLERHLTPLEAGIVQSLVLGGRYYLPERSRELFVRTGTAHILAISGMNVGGMAYILFMLLNVLRMPRKAQITLTCLLLTGYCAMTGANPSVVRATVMAVIMFAAFLFERRTDTLNSLGLAAVVILLFDPMALFDIGFQLSFAGVLSIVCLYPGIYRLIQREKTGRVMSIFLQTLSISTAAWVGVLPLVAYHFQIVTPVSIIANIPIIPFVSALFMLGVGLIVAGMVFPPAAFLFVSCIKLVLYALMMIVQFFSSWPLGCFHINEISWTGVAVYYLIVIVLLHCISRFGDLVHAHQNLHFLN